MTQKIEDIKYGTVKEEKDTTISQSKTIKNDSHKAIDLNTNVSPFVAVAIKIWQMSGVYEGTVTIKNHIFCKLREAKTSDKLLFLSLTPGFPRD